MMSLIAGSLVRSTLSGPIAIVAAIAAIFAICGCVKCMRCAIRDCACCKRLLRCCGCDKFDDFELMMVVHEVMFDKTAAKTTTIVRVTAGAHMVKTDPNTNGIIQQPLHICVEQGVQAVVVDMLDSWGRVLATHSFRPVEDILEPEHMAERTFKMKQKGKGVRNPRIKLTLSVQNEDDVETGLLPGVSSDVDNLVRLQLVKARDRGQTYGGEGPSEIDILKQACSGPLELFEGLGATHLCFISVIGPPASKHWSLGIWHDSHDEKEKIMGKKKAFREVDMLRIESVQADSTRHHVFVINYFDECRVRQTMSFRRTDRARDVWVEVIRMFVQKVRDAREQGKGRAHMSNR